MMFIDAFLPLGMISMLSLLMLLVDGRWGMLGGMLWILLSLTVLSMHGAIWALAGMLAGWMQFSYSYSKTRWRRSVVRAY